jgi:hypothetical protein
MNEIKILSTSLKADVFTKEILEILFFNGPPQK